MVLHTCSGLSCPAAVVLLVLQALQNCCWVCTSTARLIDHPFCMSQLLPDNVTA